MIAQYVPMEQTFTERQWRLFKKYQIKFAKGIADQRRLETELKKIERSFAALHCVAQITILAFTVFQGIYITY